MHSEYLLESSDIKYCIDEVSPQSQGLLILLIHALEKSISSIPKVTLIFDKTVDDCSLFDFNAIVGIHENFSSFNF